MSWQVYILRCADDSFYVGHSNNLEQRMQAHNSGKGAMHTAKHRPVVLVYTEPAENKSLAIRREQQIKKWSKAKKEALIKQDLIQLKKLSKCRSKQPNTREWP